MQYTGATLITEIIKEIGENTSTTNYRLFVLNWFQEGFDILINELRDSNFLNVVENLSTVASTNGYSVTNGELIQGNIISVRNKNNNYSLTYIDLFEIKRLNWDLESEGTPRYYYQYGYDLTKKSALIYFYPIPNAIYSLEVSYKIQSYLFADDSTVVRIPRYLVSPLRFYVKAMACAREDQDNQSQAYLQLFYKQIQDLKRTRSTIADETELQISDIPDQYYTKRGKHTYNWDSIGGGFTGGVSSVSIAVPSYMAQSGSPISSSGTITLSFNPQSGRKFFASPADGSNGAMTMRPIFANDLPTHTHVSADITDLSGGGSSFIDSSFEIKDNLDNTKKLAFQVSDITTSTTRTLTIPDVSGTIDLTNNAVTLQNKTLDNTNILSIKDSNFEIVDDGDTTKKFKVQLSGITTATTRTFTPPNANFTLNTITNGKLLYASADNVISELTLGTNLSISSGTLNASGGGSVTFDAIGDSVATGTIDNIGYAQNWTWNSLAGATGLKLSSTSTAAASNAQILFEIALSGANSTSSQTTYAAKFTNSHTGTSSTNTALYLSASGGSINNALYSAAGDVILVGGANSVYFQASTGHLIIRNGNTYSTNFYSDNDLGINGTAILLKYSTTYTTNMKITTGGSLAGIIAHHGSTAKTANYTLSASEDSNVTHTNVGASGTVTETLPSTPVLGERHRLVRVAAFTFEFLANTGQTIRDAGSVSSSGGKLQLNNVGDVVEVEYVDTNKWFVIYKNVASAPTLT